MPSKHDAVRESIEAREREKRIRQAQERAKTASKHKRGVIGGNIGRIRRGES